MESEQLTNGTGGGPQHGEPGFGDGLPAGNGPPGHSGEQPRRRKRRFFTASNILGIVLCVLLLPGFAVSAALLISPLIHPGVPPTCLGYTPLMVETGSMAPLFDENDLVLVKNSGIGASYGVGDIICFRSGNVYVTHRIHEITDDGRGNTVYITKGDANNTPDRDPVYPAQILGIYAAHLDGWGRALLFIQTPVGMIVCVMLPIFVVFLLFTVPPRIAAYRYRKKRMAARGVGNGGGAPNGHN